VSRSLTKLVVQPARRIAALLERYRRGDRLRIYIARDVIAISRTRGRFRTELREKAVIPLPSTPHDSARNISEALRALTAWLHDRPHLGPVEWIIGSDHVRYLTLPWDEQLSSKAFCHTLAKALLSRQIDGNDTTFSSALLRLAPVSYGHPRLAAWIPDRVVHTLLAFSNGCGWRTTKITPVLAVVWDSFFDHFRKGEGVLALIEGERLYRASYDRGNIVELTVRPFRNTDRRFPHSDVDFVFPANSVEGLGSKALKVQGMVSGDDLHMAYALCGVL